MSSGELVEYPTTVDSLEGGQGDVRSQINFFVNNIVIGDRMRSRRVHHIKYYNFMLI